MMSVDTESIEQMLLVHGATAACSSCGRNGWLTLPGGWTIELPLSDNAGSVPSVIAIACRHCGFLRLHVDAGTGFDPA